VKIFVQYPRDAQLTSQRTEEGYAFTLDGRRFFRVLATDRGVRIDSEARMGRRKYYYADAVTLRFGRERQPIVMAKGHPTKPIGFEEEEFVID